MNLPWVCGMNCHYIRHSLDFFLDTMAGLGIREIELWGASPHFYLEDIGPEDVAALRKKLDSRGLQVVCLTPEQVTYPVNIAAEDERLRLRSIAYYCKAVACAAELGTGMVLLTPGTGCLDRSREEALARSLDAAARIARCAEQHGVTLALEHLSPLSSNLVNTAADIRAYMDAVGSPRLKAMFDLVQVHIVGEQVGDYLELLGDELVHIHIADGTPGGHLAVGDGALPLAQDLQVILSAGYRGAITMELADRRYFTDPARADRQSLDAISRYVRELAPRYDSKGGA